jgi:hypothetical protein
VISIIDIVASTQGVAEPFTLNMSVVSITILFPAIISTEDPDGIGISLTIYVSSPDVTN